MAEQPDAGTEDQSDRAVAVETGFYDQAHLTWHFKRIVGLTPGRFVRNDTNP